MAQSTSKTSLVVGIAGGSASGKTTFAAALSQTLQEKYGLRVEVFGMDRYFWRDKERGPTFVSPSTGEEHFNANHPDSADNARLLADLTARQSAEDAPDVFIVEGLMALHVPMIRERLDLRLFMELDTDERALRRLVRGLRGERGNTDPTFIVAYYRECARVGHALYVEPSRVHADLILRGDADSARTAPLVAAVVRASLNEKRGGADDDG